MAEPTAAVPLLDWVQHTALSAALRESTWAIMGLQAVHLVGLALLGGAATLLGLSALRRGGLRGLSVTTLARGLSPLLVAGLLLMAASGSLIAVAMPYKYYLNGAFRLKMLLLLAALGATAGLWRSVDGAALAAQRRLALAAFLLWLGVGVSGRLIGFL